MEHRRIDPSNFNLLIVISPMMHFILPIRIVIFPPLSYLGLVVFVAGIVLNVSAMGHLRRNLTTVAFGERSGVLATDGPYRISRNPIYLSGIILLLGPAIFLGSLITFVFLVVSHGDMDGYNCFSFIRASVERNCQSIFAFAVFRSKERACASFSKACSSGI